MFEAYHVLLAFPHPTPGAFDQLEQQLRELKEGGQSHKLPDGRTVFYTGQTPADGRELIEAADRLEAEDGEGQGVCPLA